MATELPAGVDPKAIVASLAQFKANHEAIDEHWERLRDEHDGAWVASHDGEFVFGSSIQDVLACVRKRRWPIDVVPVRHLVDRAPVLL